MIGTGSRLEQKQKPKHLGGDETQTTKRGKIMKSKTVRPLLSLTIISMIVVLNVPGQTPNPIQPAPSQPAPVQPWQPAPFQPWQPLPFQPVQPWQPGPVQPVQPWQPAPVQ